MRSILLIEYEYIRIYIHSLTLQAFVNRAVASTPSKQNLDIPNESTLRNDSVTSNGNNAVPLEDVRKWMEDDAPYVHELVAACQKVLSIIGEDGIPANQLKHLTVRTYFRVMTAAIFLLKVCIIFHVS